MTHFSAGRWGERPDNELPVSVAFDAVLGRADGVVVMLSGLSVYRGGLEFAIEVRAREGRGEPGEDPLGRGLFGHDRSADHLLLGVEFADGRRGTNLGRPGARADDEDGITFWSRGGGGGRRAASATWFLSPLPPPGDLRFYCAWPALGIDETATTVDASAILEASQRVVELWPWEPEQMADEAPPPRWDLPAGSWFATTLPEGRRRE